VQLGDQNTPSSPTPLDFAGVCALAFLTLFSYAIARTIADAVFLDTFPNKQLLLVWATVALAVTTTVAIYNHFASRLELMRLLVAAVTISAGFLLLLWLLIIGGVSKAAFALYIWKDVYVVILNEIIWSFANVVFPTKMARRLYGLFLLCGSLGSLGGNFAVRALLSELNPRNQLWLPFFPFAGLFALGVFFVPRARRFGAALPSSQNARSHASETRQTGESSLTVLINSPYLSWLLLLIGAVQLSITMIEFDFYAALKASYQGSAAADLIAIHYQIIDAIAFALQLASSFIISIVGVASVLVAIPFFIDRLVWCVFGHA
jgi:AAA family ATP:ADP antiporter